MYTISERQKLKEVICSTEHFDKDMALFVRTFPRSPLHRELARANRVNRLSLDRQMIYKLLERLSKEQILENRRTAADADSVSDAEQVSDAEAVAEAETEAEAAEAPASVPATKKKQSKKSSPA